jgi:hypothetical protein
LYSLQAIEENGLFFSLLLCWMGIHCGSYNVSNVSHLKSSLPPPLYLSPDSWKSFKRYHFCIYIHVYQIFAPYSHSYPLSLPPPPLLVPTLPPGQDLLHPLILQFCRRKDQKKNMTFLFVWGAGSYIGSFLVIFPCIDVL